MISVYMGLRAGPLRDTFLDQLSRHDQNLEESPQLFQQYGVQACAKQVMSIMLVRERTF